MDIDSGTTIGSASPVSSHSRSVISASTRNSDNDTLPMSSITRCDNPIAAVASSRLRIAAATSMAPM